MESSGSAWVDGVADPHQRSRARPYDGRVPEKRSPYTLRAALERQTVLAVALVALLGIVLIGISGRAPLAGALLAVLLGALALLRALLPIRAVGVLAVRSRGTDVGVLVVLATAIAVLSTSPNL